MTVPPIHSEGPNLLLNPSADGGVSGWESASPGGTLSWETTTPIAGAGSARIVTDGTAATQSLRALTASAMGGTAARSFAGRITVRGSGSLQAFLRVYYSGGASTVGPIRTFTATSSTSGATIDLATVTTNGTGTLDYVSIFVRVDGTRATTFWADNGVITGVSNHHSLPGYVTIGSPHIGPLPIGKR